MSTAVMEHPMSHPPLNIPIERPSNVTSIADATLNLRLWFGLLGNSRKVNTAQITVDADKDAIRVSKHLLESKELEAIRKADSALKRELENYSLPGFDIGIRLIPWPAVETVYARLKEYATERQVLVDNFLEAYPRLCQDAALTLRSLYNAADYPPVDYVRSKFYFDHKFMEFGVPGKLAHMNAKIFKEERDKNAQMFREAAAEARDYMRQTVAQLVSHLRDRLTPDADGKPKRLTATTVTNLQQFLGTFDLRNVSNDTELAQEIGKLQNLLGDTSAEELREKKDWRAAVADDLAKIETSLSGLVETRPGRKFRFTVE